jgi:hypothetical protein
VPKFTFQLDVCDPPAKVIGAMVDFSERRPAIWPNLTAHLYRVHDYRVHDLSRVRRPLE